MATITTDSKHYNDIASAIQEKLGTEDKYKPSAMAGAVGEVYDAGLHAMDGEAQSQTELINQIADVLENKAGTFYDAFWDALQENGTRRNYDNAFIRSGWNDVAYNPKYPIIATDGATSMLYLNHTVTDTKVPIDLSGVTTNFTFYNATKLKTIRKIIVSEATKYNSTVFGYCDSLENMEIEGTIGQNGFNVSQSAKLTHDSLMSIINALKNYADSGTTYTVTLGATNLAKLTDAEKAIATQKGWTLA